MRIASLPALLSRSLLTSASVARLSTRDEVEEDTGLLALYHSQGNSVVRCLDNTDGVPTPGNHLQLWPCDEGSIKDNQLWRLVTHPSEDAAAFSLLHVATGLCAHYDLGDCRYWLRTRLTRRHC